MPKDGTEQAQRLEHKKVHFDANVSERSPGQEVAMFGPGHRNDGTTRDSGEPLTKCQQPDSRGTTDSDLQKRLIQHNNNLLKEFERLNAQLRYKYVVQPKQDIDQTRQNKQRLKDRQQHAVNQDHYEKQQIENILKESEEESAKNDFSTEISNIEEFTIIGEETQRYLQTKSPERSPGQEVAMFGPGQKKRKLSGDARGTKTKHRRLEPLSSMNDLPCSQIPLGSQTDTGTSALF